MTYKVTGFKKGKCACFKQGFGVCGVGFGDVWLKGLGFELSGVRALGLWVPGLSLQNLLFDVGPHYPRSPNSMRLGVHSSSDYRF